MQRIVHILTELVRERGEADEEFLSQFPVDRTRISIEISNLKSYAVERAIQQSLSDPVKTELLEGYNATWTTGAKQSRLRVNSGPG